MAQVEALRASINSDVPDNTEIHKAIKEELRLAEQEVRKVNFDEAIAYYDGERPLPHDDGSPTQYSEFVSNEIANAVENALAEILPGFYGDAPVVIRPNGPADEQQAWVETEIVNHVAMEANKGHIWLNRAIKDAMLFRSGFVKIFWKNDVSNRGRRVKSIGSDVLAQLYLRDMVSGAAQSVDGQGFDVDVVDKTVRGKPVIQWIPSNEMLINQDHEDTCLDEARFVCHQRRVPASDLVAFGIDKEVVDGLSDVSSSNSGINYVDRKRKKTGDNATRPIIVSESYYWMDVDGDGIAELRMVLTAGGSRGDEEVLVNEPWDEQPFAHGVCFFAPRFWRGVSYVDKLKQIQDYKSDLMRQILSVGWRNLQGRVKALERQVNMTDLLDSKSGGVVRVKSMDAVDAFPDVSLPHQSFAILEQLDKLRRESGGGSIDSAPNAQELGADSAHGLERIMSSIEELPAMVAKNVAETLVSEVYKKVHRLLRLHWRGVINSHIQGTWLEQTPQAWAERNDLKVSAGLSMGDRMRQAAHLDSLIAQQTIDSEKGPGQVLVSPQSAYLARVNSARFKGIQFPERYWINPDSPQGKQVIQGRQQAVEMRKKEAKEQAVQQSQTLIAIEQVKAEASKTNKMIESMQDKYEADLKHIEKTVDQRLKLIELNAEHDEEEVPDSMGGQNSV